MIENVEQFKNSIKKNTETRVHKINNSLGVYDIYKYIRKNKWFDIGRPVTEHEFYSIIRTINLKLVEYFLQGYDIVFPHKMGKLELRKYDAKFKFDNGKLKTNLPIDWNKTMELWYEDEESYKKKTLVKMEEKEIFKVFYNRSSAEYINKSFYQLRPNRELKIAIKNKIKNKQLDAYLL